MISTIARTVAVVLAVALLSAPGTAFGESGGGSDEGPADGAAAAESAGTSNESTSAAAANVPEAAREDTIHGGWLVLASYIILWLLVLAYVVYLGSRQRQLSAEIDDLEERIDETLADSAEKE